MKKIVLFISFLLLSILGKAQYSGTGFVALATPVSATGIQWYTISTGTPSAISGQTSTTFAASQPGIYFATYTLLGSASCTDYNIVIAQGNSATLNGTTNNAGGTSYQWFRQGTVVAGATSPDYVASIGGSYRLEFENGGVCSIKSDDYNVYTLTPCATPSVGGTAAYSGGTVCPTSNAGTITLSGQTGSVVKWQTSTDGGTTWTDLAGFAAKNYYSFINAANNQQYRAVINSGAGCTDAFSAPAIITVNATACSSVSCDKAPGTVVLTATPAVSGSQYTNVVIMTNAAGVIQYASAPASNSLTGVVAGNYFVYLVTYDNTLAPLPTLTTGTSLSGIGGNCSMFSNQLAIQVCAVAPPTIAITSPANVTTTNTNPPISGTATALASVTVNGPNGQVCLTTANASGAWTCSSLTFTVGAQTVTAIASNTAGVSTIATTNFTVVSGVSCPNPSVGGSVAFAGTLPLCSVSNGGSLNLTGNTGSVVKWQTSTNGGSTWTDVASTATSLAFTNAANNQQYRAVVNSGGSCANATSSPVTITTTAGACTVACAVLPGTLVK